MNASRRVSLRARTLARAGIAAAVAFVLWPLPAATVAQTTEATSVGEVAPPLDPDVAWAPGAEALRAWVQAVRGRDADAAWALLGDSLREKRTLETFRAEFERDHPLLVEQADRIELALPLDLKATAASPRAQVDLEFDGTRWVVVDAKPRSTPTTMRAAVQLATDQITRFQEPRGLLWSLAPAARARNLAWLAAVGDALSARLESASSLASPEARTFTVELPGDANLEWIRKDGHWQMADLRWLYPPDGWAPPTDALTR